MTTIQLHGRSIDVNIESELREFEWDNATWSESKLIASSPFRYDKSPSFFVNLDGEYAGTWGDAGAYETAWESGNIVKLLAFLRQESYEESLDYLLSVYDLDYSSDMAIDIDIPSLDKRKGQRIVDAKAYAGKPLDTSYLPRRGIHPKVIELQGVFDNGNSVGIPWRNSKGEVVNVMYRMKRGKAFWYEKGATPIRQLVYGIDTIVKRGITRVVVCEAPIDAMTWQSAGIYAVAVGGVNFTDRHRELLLKSGVTDVILGGDNDKAGAKLNEQIADSIGDYVDLHTIDLDEYKDANEAGVKFLRDVEIVPNKLAIKL